MAQPQRLADVHQDELCPPNKCYALMDSNKKIDLDNLLIFHPPQATDNNHERFVAAPKFSVMVPFFLNTLGFNLELRSPSNFKTTGLVQPWQTLGNTFARCLTTRVTGHDQPPLQIMQIYIQLSLAEYNIVVMRLKPECRNGQKSEGALLIAEEIEKLVEGAENVENVEVNSSTLRQDDTQIYFTGIEEEESAEDDYKLNEERKGKHVEESRITPSPTTIRSPRTHSNLISLDTEKL
ncbi:hypothetical protein Tco_0780322 [Tanacetum coccineum]